MTGDRDRDGGSSERDSIFRIRDRHWLVREDLALSGGRGSHDNKDHRSDSLPSAADLLSKKNQQPGGQSAIYFGDELQFWPEKDGQPSPRFSHIAAMHSELTAVNTNGQLCQWRWIDHEPYSFTAQSEVGTSRLLV